MLHFKPMNQNKSHLIVTAFRAAANCETYWNQWLTDTEWVSIINGKYLLESGIVLTTTELNRIIGRQASLKDIIDNLINQNTIGIFRAKYRPSTERADSSWKQGQRIT